MRTNLYILMLLLFASVSTLSVTAEEAVQNNSPAGLTTGGSSAWIQLSGECLNGNDAAQNVSFITAKGTQAIPVVLMSKHPQKGAFTLQAILRMRNDAGVTPSASFSVCKINSDDPGFDLRVTQGYLTDSLNWEVYDRNAKLLTPEMYYANPDGGPIFDELKAYQQFLPGWPREFRTLIEKDMLTQPGVNSRWVSIRIEVKNGYARFWADDRLLTQEANASIVPEGFVRFSLSPGAELTSLIIQPLALEETSGYLPLHLDGYLNEKNLLPDMAVSAGISTGTVLKIGGIPFVFPNKSAAGYDHIDLGRSLYRQGNSLGYELAYTYPFKGAFLRDPARIQLAVPNGQYDSIYLIAAADGEQDSIPEMTAMFYRPGAGFAENFAATVPLATAVAKATRLPVKLSNGKKVSLWLVKIPLDPGKLSAFSDLKVVDVELTKRVYQYRSYPDPIRYGWHQGGLPSGVHVYAMTLGKTPAGFTITPDKFGHVWTEPEVPGYTLAVTNRTSKAQKGVLTITTRSYDGSESSKQKLTVKLAANSSRNYSVNLPVKLYGYHDVVAYLNFAGHQWTEKRSLVKLAPDRRSPRWTGKGALFGYWGYHGGHYTPPANEDVRLMTAAGARNSSCVYYDQIKDIPEARDHWSSLTPSPYDVYMSYVDENTYVTNNWARIDPGNDPVKQEEFNKQRADFKVRVLANMKKMTFSEKPDEFQPDFVTFYPEPHISMSLTTGNFGSYYGEEESPLTQEEKDSVRQYVVMTTAAAEVVRENWPKVKVLVPWGDPLFVVPLLRAGLSKDLIDGSGLDNPNFERLPEQQLHQISLHRLLELKSEYAKAGIPNPDLYYIEGPFVPTEVGANTWREQMDIYSRFTLISMAYGVKRFYSGWFAFDAGTYYGSEHYGGCGLQRRIPYCDPKPAYAAYATMTDKLDQADFVRWLPTGSLTTYCLQFNGPRGNVYSLWTIRGKRQVTLTLPSDSVVEVTDSMNNMKKYPTKNGQVTISTDASVIYVTGVDITSVKAGTADHTDAAPAAKAKFVGNFGDGTWSFLNKPDKTYEEGSYAIKRYFGDFTGKVVMDQIQGNVFRSTMEKQANAHDLMPFYNVIAPVTPINMPGAPSHIGIWVKGNSDWGRVIYSLRDAKGERWISTGTKDDWNCDDMHSWSSFNFDGWRYLKFELPGHTGYDSYRKHGTTWWRSLNGDGIVDLPLSLEKVIIEQRTHVIYVNDAQPVASNTVDLGKIFLEYSTPFDMTEGAVKESKLRQPMPTDIPSMPNPIADMQKTGVGDPTNITKVQSPEAYYDGTRAEVIFSTVPGASKYFIWVSAHPDGQGAINMSPADGTPSGSLIYGLRPGIPLYYWVVYEDVNGKLSKPSPSFTCTLFDEFGNK